MFISIYVYSNPLVLQFIFFILFIIYGSLRISKISTIIFILQFLSKAINMIWDHFN